jgi:hypothetical protein
VQAARLLQQIRLKKSTPARVDLVLEGTIVSVRWKGRVEVGFGHPWPAPGGRQQLTPSPVARRRGRGGKLWRGEEGGEGGTSAIAGSKAVREGRKAMGIGSGS